MSTLLPFVITGIVTGSLYGLAGVGLVLTYRTSGVFNVAHGTIAAAAAYLFHSLHFERGLPWPVAAAITIAAFGLVAGVLLELIARVLTDVPEAVVVVATVGLLLGTQGVLFLIYGNITKDFPDFLPTTGFTISGVNVSWAQVLAVVIATVASLGLYVFLRFGRYGVAMRAVVDNPTLVELAGHPPVRIRRAAWIIGASFAAMSGILLAPTLGLDVTLLTLLVVQAFGACAVGLFSSLPLTYVGGIGIGILASVATRYITEPPFNGVPSAVPFLVLIVVLLAVPASKLPRRPSSAVVAPTSAGLGLGRNLRYALAAAGLAAVVLVPAVVGPKLPLWIGGATYVTIFGSLALLVWTSGQLSLCHAAFVAFGASTCAHMVDAGLPWALALVAAGLLTVPVGVLVAIPAVRLSGIYLALLTLGFGIVMQNVLFAASPMFGSDLTAAVSRPVLGPLDGTSDSSMYFIAVAVAVATCAALWTIRRGQLGRVLHALAETPTMLATHGLSVTTSRLIAFSVSAFLAGIGGGLLVTSTSVVSGTSFGPITSLLLLAVLTICGTHVVRAPIAAALLIAVVPGYVTAFDADRQLLGFGVVALVACATFRVRKNFPTAVRDAQAGIADRLRHGPVTARRLRANTAIAEAVDA